MTTLALKYRPRRFGDLVGQVAPRVVLSRMITADTVFPALLLYGALGSGKTSAARVFVAALNCTGGEDPAQRPCTSCPSCRSIVAGTSGDVTEVDAASSGLADDIRKLREQVRYASAGRYRAVVLDEAHAMSNAGAEALLKVLEEPPPHVVFILVTTELDKISDTIASRCRSLQFSRIPADAIAERLVAIAAAESLTCSPELATAIAAWSRGVMRNAVSMLEQCALVGVTTPEQFVKLTGDVDHGPRLLAALAAPGGPRWPEAFSAVAASLQVLPSSAALVSELVACLRRVLVLSCGGEVVPAALPAEKQLAGELSAGQITRSMSIIWTYYTDVAPAADSYAAMDLLVTLLGRSFSTSKQ